MTIHLTINISSQADLSTVIDSLTEIRTVMMQTRDILNQVLTRQVQTQEGVDHMSEQLDRLKTEVQENRQVVDSAVTLIQGLAQQIRDAQDDPAALGELADSLDSSSQALAAAVAANTPASTGDNNT